MVLPADKGRPSVVMDVNSYHAKMSSLIKNGPYQLLNKDPIDRTTSDLGTKSRLDSTVYRRSIRPKSPQDLSCHDLTPPRMIYPPI